MARVQDYIIGFVFVGIMASALLGFMTGIYSEYGITQGENYENVYNNLSSLVDTAKGYSEEVSEKAQVGEKAEVALGFTLFTALDIITFPFRAIGVIGDMLTFINNEIGFPIWLFNGVLTIIIVVLVYLVANAMFSRGNI